MAAVAAPLSPVSPVQFKSLNWTASKRRTSVVVEEVSDDEAKNTLPPLQTQLSKSDRRKSSNTAARRPSITLVTSPKTVRQSSITQEFTDEVEHLRLSFAVLNTLEKWGRHLPAAGKGPEAAIWPGKSKFLSQVYHHVRQNQPIQMTMPAFPCKSANRVNKVLGALPDLGEEIALTRLDEMCKSVEKVYAPGAQVNIATDGVLFNDILGISDEDCWDYGESLHAIMKAKNLTHINYVRCTTLLGYLSEKETTKEKYLEIAATCRKDLEARFAPSDDAIAKEIKNDKDTNMTYCGMVKFLESELEASSLHAHLKGNKSAKIREQKKIAKKMMQRSEAFTYAIRTYHPLHVRLSMHPSTGAAKLSFPMVPTKDGGFQKSPWHSCVAVQKDGSHRAVHQDEVRDTYELVERFGRPYYFQER